MSKSILLSLVFSLLASVCFSQKETKIYYDANWMVVPSKEQAIFYRVVQKKLKTDQGGKVKDYFITGELQGQGDALFIDPENDANSKWKGKLIGYYQSGTRRFENSYSNDGIANGKFLQWFDTGAKEMEVEYKDGMLNGHSISYFPHGGINTKSTYVSNRVVGKWLSCTYEGKCMEHESEEFFTDKDDRGWNVRFNTDNETEIFQYTGLRMYKVKQRAHSRAVNWNINPQKDFEILGNVTYTFGDQNLGFGLVYAYQDSSNYHLFFINADGKYKIGKVAAGKMTTSKWKSSELILKAEEYNALKIIKKKNSIEYFINDNSVHSSTFEEGKGNLAGVGIEEGKQHLQVYLGGMFVAVEK